MRDSHPDNDWVTVGPAKFASLVTPSPHKVSVLKMDCEGCEYALYDHAMEHDSLFFERVDQFVIEAHLSRKWAADWKSVLNYGRLLALLQRAGFHLYDARIGWCSGGEPMGLDDLFVSSGYYRRSGGHCENLLFARAHLHGPQASLMPTVRIG